MKKVCNIILIVLISLSYLLIVGNYIINKNLYSTISSTFTSKRIASNIVTAIFNRVPETSINKLSNIQSTIEKSPYIDSISKKYIDAMVNDIKKGSASNVNIDSEIDGIISSISSEFSEEEINKIKDEIKKNDINVVYKYSYDSLILNSGFLIKFILTVYSITSSFKYLFYVLIAVLFIILFIINKQRFKILSITFASLTLVSIGFILFDKLFLENKLMLILNENINIIDTNIFYSLSAIFISISIILAFISIRVKESK